MKDGPAATGDGGGAERGRGGVERGSDERKRGVYERASELHVGTKPVRGFTNDPENMGEGSRTSLFCRKARGRAGASDSVVRLRITATFESSTHDCGYGMMVPSLVNTCMKKSKSSQLKYLYSYIRKRNV